MNKQRRNRIAKAFDMIAEAIEIIEEVKEEEEESLENLPESFRYGERGEEMEGYVEMLDESVGYLQDAISVLGY